MPDTDIRDVPDSSGTPQFLARYGKALALLNSYFLDPLEEIEAALSEDPGFVMGHSGLCDGSLSVRRHDGGGDGKGRRALFARKRDRC